MSINDKASTTAAQALAEIARSGARTLRATVVIAVATSVLALAACFAVGEYLRLKWAMQSAAADFASHMKAQGDGGGWRPPNPGGLKPQTGGGR